MNERIFTKYFRDNLRGNPYYDEICQLLKEQQMTGSMGKRSMQELQDALVDGEVGDYRISTMTCIYNMKTELDEQKIYAVAQPIIDGAKRLYQSGESSFYVKGVECFNKPIVGEQVEKKRGHLSTRKFRNQITLIIWSDESDKYIKVKLFRTGKAQMTGVTSEAGGNSCIQFILRVLNEHMDFSEPLTWDPSNMSVAMMNGDFSVGFPIRREILNSDICRWYNIKSNLDADTYPGVIMNYELDGKTVTMSVFSSGKVIITGGKSREQIETCVRLVRFLCSKI